jgi:predicted  nucleic acid-binding Zn-ribbon protein
VRVIEEVILKLENQEKELRVKINNLQKELKENKMDQERTIFIENELRKLHREENKVKESIADLKHDLSILNSLDDKEEENIIKTIKIDKDITVYKGNIRNEKGNKLRKDRVLKAGTYELLETFIITSGMVYHGETAYRLTDGKLEYIISESQLAS